MKGYGAYLGLALAAGAIYWLWSARQTATAQGGSGSPLAGSGKLVLATPESSSATTNATMSAAGSSNASASADPFASPREWSQEQSILGQAFRESATSLGHGPANDNASRGFNSGAYKRLQLLRLT